MSDIEEIIKEFTDIAAKQFDRDRIETFWGLESDFRQLVANDFAGKVMNLQVRKVATQPTYLGDWRPNQIILHRAPAIALALASFESARQHIHSFPFFAMYSPAGGIPLRFNRYRLPNSFKNEVFNPAVRLIPDGSGAVEPGEVLKLHSEQYVYDFVVTEPQMIVKLTTSAFQTQEWLFNRETLSAWQAIDSEMAATQLRVSAYAVSRLANTSSLEALVAATEHTHHTVRWAAIQAIGRLSRSSAMEVLEVAINDPHPHVAKAAAKTLAMLKSKNLEASGRGN